MTTSVIRDLKAVGERRKQAFDGARRDRERQQAQTGRTTSSKASTSTWPTAGSLSCLSGPSGCGKTTTLRMIAGLETVTSGTIRIGDRDATQLRLGLRNCAMVFQTYALYPHMTVAQNIGVSVIKVAGHPADGASSRRKAAKDAARAARHQRALPRALVPASCRGGVSASAWPSAARSCASPGRLPVRRQPLSNLDAKLRDRVCAPRSRRCIARSPRRTSIYVTHDQVEAMTMADRVIVMNRGKIEQQPTRSRSTKSPAISSSRASSARPA